ncbi:MAG: lactonase family protein, partial [Demequina sp.]
VGEGLWRQTADDARLALELPAPSFVVAHPDLPLLYAVSETESSEVHAIDVSDPDHPSVAGTVRTEGASGCHLLLSADARVLYVCHYESGDIAVVLLGEDGLPTLDEPAQTFGHEGSGPREDRQEAPHAHFAGFGPGGHHVLVCDLGTDELRRYAIQPGGLLEDHGVAATLPPGAGPRHFVVRGEWIYVLCELDHRLRALRWDAATGTAEVVFDIASTTAPHRTGTTIYDSHVLLAGGDTLLAGVRGCDVISVIDLSPEGEPRYRGCFDAGHWPRHFAAVGDRLHVGAEKGHEVRTFALADVLGLPPESEVGHIAQLPYSTAPLPSPACVVAHPTSSHPA